MKIGEVASSLGVAVHVLRHWDAEGVVVPDRTPFGHRDYTEEHIARLRILQSCQSVGMSLSEIRQVLRRHEAGRTMAIERRLLEIRAQQRHLERAERFLVHVLACEHDLVTKCDGCSEYVTIAPAR